MYDSCLVCHGDLGTNQVISSFPVGQRIAFDPEEGRIWVLCPSCHEWNLAPIEERWEAIDQCEAAFHAAIQRLSSKHGAVAAIDGTEVIRIGGAKDDGLATWRYEERLETRHNVKLTLKRGRAIGRSMALAVGLVVPPLLLGSTGLLLSSAELILAVLLVFIASERRQKGIIARVEDSDGRWIDVRRRDLASVRFVPGSTSWRLRIRGRHHLSGVHAIRATRLLLPHLNWRLSEPALLKKAVNYILSHGRSPDRVFKAAARRRGAKRTARLAKLDPHIRLALEMVANEEAERETIRSELRHLHGEWKQAHELAKIQDELLVPEPVQKHFEELLMRKPPDGASQPEG